MHLTYHGPIATASSAHESPAAAAGLIYFRKDDLAKVDWPEGEQGGTLLTRSQDALHIALLDDESAYDDVFAYVPRWIAKQYTRVRILHIRRFCIREQSKGGYCPANTVQLQAALLFFLHSQ